MEADLSSPSPLCALAGVRLLFDIPLGLRQKGGVQHEPHLAQHCACSFSFLSTKAPRPSLTCSKMRQPGSLQPQLAKTVGSCWFLPNSIFRETRPGHLFLGFGFLTTCIAPIPPQLACSFLPCSRLGRLLDHQGNGCWDRFRL